jgi:hypothetical protein
VVTTHHRFVLVSGNTVLSSERQEAIWGSRDGYIRGGVRRFRLCDDCGAGSRRTEWEPLRETVCVGCDRPLVIWGRTDKDVCGRACLKRLKRRQARQEPEPVVCATCGTTFTPARSDARYCSNACRQRAHRQRHAA